MRNGLLCSLVLLLVLLSAGCAEEDLLPADRRTGDNQLTDIWITICVTAQFRDATGYLSLIYADEIAIEGSPPSP